MFFYITADISQIPAKRKRKILTPAETKSVTYTENTLKPSDQTVSPAKRTEHESKSSCYLIKVKETNYSC